MRRKILAFLLSGWATAAIAGPEPDVLTIDEAAVWLRVPTEQIQALAEQGALPARRIGSSGWRFDRRALTQWLSVEVTGDASKGNETPPTVTGDHLSAEAPKRTELGAKARVSGDDSRSALPTAEETALREVSLMGKPGSWFVEGNLSYSFGDAGSRGFGLFGGRGETDTFLATLGAKYMLNETTQIYATIPYLAKRSKVEDVVAGEIVRSRETQIQSFGIGLRRQLLPEAVGSPQLVGALDLSFPMANGIAKRVGAELSLVKTTDPIALYGMLRVERTVGGVTGDGGNRFIASAGYVYALNEMLALSTSVTARVESGQDESGLGWHHRKHFEIRLGLPVSLGRSGVFLEPHVAFSPNQSDSSVTIGVAIVKAFDR